MSFVTGERRETEWLLQRCPIAMARGNATSVLLTGSSGEDTGQESPERPALSSVQGAFPSRAGQCADMTIRRRCHSLLHRVGRQKSTGVLTQMVRRLQQTSQHVRQLYSTATSRNPLDDPELARYLLPRVSPRSADPDELTSQELGDRLLHITPGSSYAPRPPRPNALAAYVAVLGELREGAPSYGEQSEPP